MKNLALITKRRVLQVVDHNDGTISILKSDGTQIAKMDAYIADMGGVGAILAKSIQFEGDFAEFLKAREEKLFFERQEARLIAEENRLNNERLHAERWAALKAMPEIPVTEENLRVVMRELNSQNWGSWTLPKMSIGYKAAQFDCGGKTATTITFDRPVKLNEYREPSARFEYGAPRGHLSNYQSI